VKEQRILRTRINSLVLGRHAALLNRCETDRVDLTGLDGTLHACDITSSRDQVVVYPTGEELIKNGSHCCGPRRSR